MKNVFRLLVFILLVLALVLVSRGYNNYKNVVNLKARQIEGSKRMLAHNSAYQDIENMQSYLDNEFTNGANGLVCDNNKLVLFFNNTCKECIYKTIMDLNVISSSVGAENIILLGNFDNENDLCDFLQNINDNFQFYNSKEMIGRSLLVDEEQLLFMLNPSLKVEDIFIVNDLNNQLLNEYLSNVRTKWFSQYETIDNVKL